MGVVLITKPISVLGFRDFALSNLQKIYFGISSGQESIGMHLVQGEPAKNQRLCRITSNAASCVDEVRL